MASRQVTIPQTEVHPLRSSQVDDGFELWVAHPVASPWQGEIVSPRVLYVLDANLWFGTVVETTRLMHSLFGELPPFLVVGIAYPTHDRTLQSELRSRDFTPSEDSSVEEMSRMVPDREPSLPEGERLGGAGRFLAFLREDVLPFIEERYDVAEEGSTLFGSSLGGLFALYTLLTAPGTFDNTIVSSPAIWWDDAMLFDLEESLADESDDLSAGLFMAVGALEEDERVPMLARFALIGNVVRLGETLAGRDYPSFDLTVRVLDDETHTSVVPVALTRGLRTLFTPTSARA